MICAIAVTHSRKIEWARKKRRRNAQNGGNILDGKLSTQKNAF